MYCSSCGVSLAQGLSYCNYCGAKLNAEKRDETTKSSELRPESLMMMMTATFIFGLVAITMLMGMLKAILRLEVEVVLAIALLPFLLLLLLEGIYIRLLLRRTRATEERDAATPLKGHTTKELNAAHARALSEPLQSVTDHTTRTFETIYTERKSE
jgi:hypothetical protein